MVTIIGLGALGSVFTELAVRNGINDFVLYDDDVVEKKNLERQWYYLKDVGKYKVDAAKEKILSINPKANVIAKRERLFPEDLITDDIIIECTDNMKNKVVMSNYVKNVMIAGTVAGETGYAFITKDSVENIFRNPCSADDCHTLGVRNSSVMVVASLMMSLLLDYLKEGYRKRILYFNKNKVVELKIKQ